MDTVCLALVPVEYVYPFEIEFAVAGLAAAFTRNAIRAPVTTTNGKNLRFTLTSPVSAPCWARANSSIGSSAGQGRVLADRNLLEPDCQADESREDQRRRGAKGATGRNPGRTSRLLDHLRVPGLCWRLFMTAIGDFYNGASGILGRMITAPIRGTSLEFAGRKFRLVPCDCTAGRGPTTSLPIRPHDRLASGRGWGLSQVKHMLTSACQGIATVVCARHSPSPRHTYVCAMDDLELG